MESPEKGEKTHTSSLLVHGATSTNMYTDTFPISLFFNELTATPSTAAATYDDRNAC